MICKKIGLINIRRNTFGDNCQMKQNQGQVNQFRRK